MPPLLDFLRSFLFVWYNLPFLLLLLICLGLGLLQLVGGDDGGDADADVDADADADGGDGPAFSVLQVVGFGQAPLLVVLMILFSSIGVSGLTLNWIAFRMFGTYTGVSFALVLVVALGLGLTAGAVVTRMIRTILPPLTTTASRAQELVGQHGVVISPFVDDRYGQVRLRNPGDVMISIFAITHSALPIKRGDEVVLEAYDAAKKLYSVMPAPKA